MTSSKSDPIQVLVFIWLILNDLDLMGQNLPQFTGRQDQFGRTGRQKIISRRVHKRQRRARFQARRSSVKTLGRPYFPSGFATSLAACPLRAPPETPSPLTPPVFPLASSPFFPSPVAFGAPLLAAAPSEDGFAGAAGAGGVAGLDVPAAGAVGADPFSASGAGVAGVLDFSTGFAGAGAGVGVEAIDGALRGAGAGGTTGTLGSSDFAGTLGSSAGLAGA